MLQSARAGQPLDWGGVGWVGVAKGRAEGGCESRKIGRNNTTLM